MSLREWPSSLVGTLTGYSNHSVMGAKGSGKTSVRMAHRSSACKLIYFPSLSNWPAVLVFAPERTRNQVIVKSNSLTSSSSMDDG